VNAWGKVHGVTDRDPVEMDGTKDWQQFSREQWHAWGLEWRPQQIYRYVQEHGSEGCTFVVLDDLELDMPELIKTERHGGLEEEHADRAILALNGMLDLRSALLLPDQQSHQSCPAPLG
jgi:hypothetical protein